MRRRTVIKKKLVLKALDRTLGDVTESCRVCGIGKTQFYEWLKVDPEFAAEVEVVYGTTQKLKRAALIVLAEQGNATAILKMNAIERGQQESK